MVLIKWFITTPATAFPGTNFSTTGCVGETEIATDWWYSIGDADSAMSMHCAKNRNGYIATITYNLIDFYDWE